MIEGLPAKPWLRLEGESEKAFEGFCQYRDQPPPRSLARVFGARKTEQMGWYVEWRWVDRCKAWDAYLDEARLAEREALVRQTAREVTAEHMRMLKHARDLASRELEKLTDISLQSDLPGTIKPADVIRLTETVVKLDRLIRGETTDNPGGAKDESLAKMSVEDLRALQALLSKGSE